MNPDLLPELLKASLLAPVVAGTSWFIWKQHVALRIIEEKRADDQKAIIGQLLGLSDKWNSTISTLMLTLESHKEVLRDVKDMLKGRD